MIHKKLTNITIGEKCQIHADALIGFSENGNGKIRIGNKVVIRDNCLLRTCGGQITILDNVVINYGFICHAMGNIIIGENTLISPNVQIYSQNHGIKKCSLIRNQKQTGFGIMIEKDCWLGAGVIITDGLTVGEGAIIGAGSVVTKNVPQYEIWAGNPAKKIGERK